MKLKFNHKTKVQLLNEMGIGKMCPQQANSTLEYENSKTGYYQYLNILDNNFLTKHYKDL